jgi:hypothetical protein
MVSVYVVGSWEQRTATFTCVSRAPSSARGHGLNGDFGATASSVERHVGTLVVNSIPNYRYVNCIHVQVLCFYNYERISLIKHTTEGPHSTTL